MTVRVPVLIPCLRAYATAGALLPSNRYLLVGSRVPCAPAATARGKGHIHALWSPVRYAHTRKSIAPADTGRTHPRAFAEPRPEKTERTQGRSGARRRTES
jgi:hypothetical protein